MYDICAWIWVWFGLFWCGGNAGNTQLYGRGMSAELAIVLFCKYNKVSYALLKYTKINNLRTEVYNLTI